MNSAAVNPAMLRCLRKHAGLLNYFIEATCGVAHWYSVKHMYYDNSCEVNSERRKTFGATPRFWINPTLKLTRVRDVLWICTPGEETFLHTALGQLWAEYLLLSQPSQVSSCAIYERCSYGCQTRDTLVLSGYNNCGWGNEKMAQRYRPTKAWAPVTREGPSCKLTSGRLLNTKV